MIGKKEEASGGLEFREIVQKNLHFPQEFRLFVWVIPCNSFIVFKAGHPPFTLFTSLYTML